MNILLIVASGKSTRFGGYPKAFCKIGNITNVENTINKSRRIIDKVYIGVNNEVYEKFHKEIKNCKMFCIKTGQGDAHSLLKCMRYVKKNEPEAERILVCWGDAVFVSESPFERALAENGKVNVVCSLDETPYAWFDTDIDKNIIKSHFAKTEGSVKNGLHDQSLFSFDLNFAINYLEEYRISLGIPEDNDEQNCDINEMKLLYSFEYLQAKGCPAKCVIVNSGNVLSFNTQEELEIIKNKLALMGGSEE